MEGSVIMPLVKIEMKKGHSKEYKKTYLQAVHDALEVALGIPEDDRYQRLYEVEPNEFEVDDNKTDHFAIIELTIFPGRTKEIKKKIIEQITKLLQERLGIVATDTFIVIHEPSFDNWGIGGKQLSDE